MQHLCRINSSKIICGLFYFEIELVNLRNFCTNQNVCYHETSTPSSVKLLNNAWIGCLKLNKSNRLFYMSLI